jgi:uroporphyrin-III C-methyltransferase
MADTSGISFGTVYLVGAGPGAPGLLTLRAKACLELADAVVYDALVNPELLERHAPQAEHVYAGKRSGRHVLPQADIQALLLDLAGRCRHVVRLKGGDPLVFGRGGEEAIFLREHGIPYEIVPGVTAGVGAAAAAGIPITHRGIARGVTFLTGHRDADGALTLDTDDLPRRGTLVFYMGVGSLGALIDLVLASGRASDTPAAIIESGTLPEQCVLTGTVGGMVELAATAAIQPPALLVVGEVVGLRGLLL